MIVSSLIFFFFHQYFLAMALRLHRPMLDADVEYTFLFRDFNFCMLLPLGRCFLFFEFSQIQRSQKERAMKMLGLILNEKGTHHVLKYNFFCTYISLWCIFCSKLYCSFYLLHFFCVLHPPHHSATKNSQTICL